MKKGENPELSVKWWKASQPKGLASGAKLESVLKAYETAVAAYDKTPDSGHLKSALDTLDEIKDAVAKAVAEAGKAKTNVEMEYTVQALKKIDFAKTAKALDGRLKSDDDDEDAPALGDPVAFAKVLRKNLNKIKDEPWNWGFLCGKKPSEHRLMLSYSKNGRTLAVAAAKQLGRAPKISSGTAIRSPEDNGLLLLTVTGPMVSGLATRCKKMLLTMKPQTITEIVLMVDGQVVREAVDPNDVDLGEEDAGAGDQAENPALEGLHSRMSALGPRLASALQAQPALADRLRASLGQVMAAMEKEDAATAGPMLGKLEEVVGRLEGARPAGAVDGVKLRQGRLAWEGTRKSVTLQLNLLEAAIIASVTQHNEDPETEDQFDLDEVKGAMPKLYRVLERYEARLNDKLDEAMNAADDDRARLSAEAAAIVKQYRGLLDGDDELVRIDGSGLGAPVRPVLEKTLTVLATMF